MKKLLTFNMKKLTFFVLLVCGVISSIQAARPKFSARVSDEFLYTGKSVKVVVTTTLTEAGPLKYRFKVPFNVSAYMRILEFKTKVDDSKITITGSKTPNYTSSAGNGNNDIVNLDLGTVTPTGTVVIEMTFYAQLLNHAKLSNGENMWINIGAEFTNGTIWAHQHAIKTFSSIDTLPVLNASITIEQMEKDDTLVDGSTVHIRVRLSHDPHKSTGEVSTGQISLLHPYYLVYSSMAKTDAKSVTVTTSSSSTTARILGVPALKFEEMVDYKLTFTIDTSKTGPKGQVHKGRVAATVSFSYNSPFYGSSRTGSVKKPVYKTIKFYAKKASCETGLGMANSAIVNSKIRASSQSTSGLASDARLNGAKAWVPATALKQDGNQFIEVDLDAVKDITRLHLQGNGVSGSYVSSLRVFYSVDCAVWKTYRTKEGNQLLGGNSGPNKVALIPFDPPIKAKCIRINPRSFYKEIGLRFELYGCAASSSPPASNLVSRTYLVDIVTDYIYICNVAMDRVGGETSCYYSKDKGVSWAGIDHDILNINFINPATKIVYGMGESNTYFMCPAAPIGKCALITKTDYDAAKAVSGVVQAKAATKITVTDDASSKLPVSGDEFAMQNSKKIGASPLGIHYWDGSAWTAKTNWLFADPL